MKKFIITAVIFHRRTADNNCWRPAFGRDRYHCDLAPMVPALYDALSRGSKTNSAWNRPRRRSRKISYLKGPTTSSLHRGDDHGTAENYKYYPYSNGIRLFYRCNSSGISYTEGYNTSTEPSFSSAWCNLVGRSATKITSWNQNTTFHSQLVS